MYLQKVISKKTFKKISFLLARGMDPRIQIRIHPKMSWIRNTASFAHFLDCLPLIAQNCKRATASRGGAWLSTA
jgi:hypothetical protein